MSGQVRVHHTHIRVVEVETDSHGTFVSLEREGERDRDGERNRERG